MSIQSKFYFKIGGEWVYQGATTDTEWSVSSLALQYAHVYSWRVDTYEEENTTTGDTWTFRTKPFSSINYNRPTDYEPEEVWGYNPDTEQYEWMAVSDAPDIMAAGGGRYNQQIVVVGHETIYYGEI